MTLLNLIFMSSRKKNNKPMRSDAVPVTQAMLYEVRDELKSHLMSNDKKFEGIDKKFEYLEAKLDTGFLMITSELHKMQAQIHKSHLLFEEQNARNKFVMDQYELVNIRQEKFRSETQQVRKRPKPLKSMAHPVKTGSQKPLP